MTGDTRLLMSCLFKLLESMVDVRLVWLLEECSLLLRTQYGFHSGLTMQAITLRLKEDVFDRPGR